MCGKESVCFLLWPEESLKLCHDDSIFPFLNKLDLASNHNYTRLFAICKGCSCTKLSAAVRTAPWTANNLENQRRHLRETITIYHKLNRARDKTKQWASSYLSLSCSCNRMLAARSGCPALNLLSVLQEGTIGKQRKFTCYCSYKKFSSV